MGMLRKAGVQLVISAIALTQVVVGGVLISYVWTPIAVVVGVLNLLYVLVTGSSFSNIDLLWEPPMWLIHQTVVLFGASSDFQAAPYVG